MAALTGEEVVSQIAINLRSHLSTTQLAAIYKNTPFQHARKPYAFIHQISADYTHEMRGRGEQTFLVDIRVHPEDGRTDTMSWARALSTTILDAVSVIQISGQDVKSKGVSWRVEDNVLHVLTSYSFKVVESPIDLPDMQELFLNDVHVQLPNILVSGEYYEGTLLSVDTHSLQIGEMIIDGEFVNLSLLAQDTSLWEQVAVGDSLVVLKSGETYYVLDALDRNRLKTAIDGGNF